MSERQTCDIAVVGGGMVGCAAACLLARCGFEVTLVEAQEFRGFDADGDYGLRVSALSPGSAAILAQAGAWARIEAGRSCAYRRMRIEDREDPSAVLEFTAPALGLERLGTIVENDLVLDALWTVARAHPLVGLRVPAEPVSLEQDGSGARLELDDGTRLRASLVVAADGALSGVREWVGARQDVWDYNQRGLVTVVRTERPNPETAWQRFLDGGPLAFLPLADGRSSIVWSLPSDEAAGLLDLDETAFNEALSRASQGWLGAVVASGPRAAFPLAMRLSDRYVAGRVVLLGDAAHLVHPLAGQGVNLGFADAAALVETLAAARLAGHDPADRAALRAFERWRRSESAVMARGIHALGGLFRQAALAPLRRLGLRAVGRSWLLSETFVRRAAGLARNAPRLSRGDNLKDLLRGTPPP